MPQTPRLASESIAGRRAHQEDAVLLETLDDGRTLVAVADGMGGHAAGEVASAVALEALRDAVKEGAPLADAFIRANALVHASAQEPGRQGMGTTLVAVLVDGDRYLVGNVGDSRCYRIDGSGIEQLTQDHSFVAEALKRGQSESEALASRWRDALTRSVGTDPEVEPDVFGPFDVAEDSALVLCSDGCYKALPGDELLAVFSGSRGPRGAAQSLVTEAYDRGSDDNITVAVAEFGAVPRLAGRGDTSAEGGDPTAEAEEAAKPWWRRIFG